MTSLGRCDGCRSTTSMDNTVRRFRDLTFGDGVLKEGWVKRREGFLKIWKPRYLVIKTDGTMLTFIKRGEEAIPEYNLNVKGCQVVPRDRPAPYTLDMTYLDESREVVRKLFRVESEEESASWITAFGILAYNTDTESSVKEAPDDKETTRPKIEFKSLEFEKVLGTGEFGKVYLCRDKETSKHYAVKKLNKDMLIENNHVVRTNTENRVLRKIKHPFLIQWIRSFQTNDQLYFVMEFANGGDLYYHLRKEKTFDESRVVIYGAELVMALSYLHESGIIYRDLKLENIMIQWDGHLKLTDFGFCKDSMAFGDVTQTFCGTDEYIAPEVVVRNNYYTFSADWWSFGIVLYEMLHGKTPFQNPDRMVTFEMITTCEPLYSDEISKGAENLLRRLLVKNPSKRLGSGPSRGLEIMKHEFFASIDWDKLYNKEVELPFVPELESETDLRYFSPEFVYTPVKLASIYNSTSNGARFFVRDEDVFFDDFDYVGNDDIE